MSEDGTRLLVVPTKTGKPHHSQWPEAERPFRSLMLDPRDGRPISVGFPKFFNYGELKEDTERLDAALLADEPVFFTEKLDGSLIIRSVIDGAVHLRTRGTAGGGDHVELAERLMAELYPVLGDPGFEPDASLLLELVSPDFRLVIDYPDDDLHLVGAVDHDTLRLRDVPELQKLGAENGLPVAEMIELPREPETLLDVVRAWSDREGVVASCASGQVLVKVKAAEYLARHRLRFALSARVVREICLERDVRSLEDFKAFLEEQNADWELVSDSRPLVETFLEARARAVAKLEELAVEVPAKAREFPGRKAFAVNYAVPLGGSETHAAFAINTGNPGRAFELLRDHYTETAFAELDARDRKLEPVA